MVCVDVGVVESGLSLRPCRLCIEVHARQVTAKALGNSRLGASKLPKTSRDQQLLFILRPLDPPANLLVNFLVATLSATFSLVPNQSNIAWAERVTIGQRASRAHPFGHGFKTFTHRDECAT